MNFRVATVALIALWTMGVLHSAVRAQPAQPSRSVWDGVYTEEQAKRGEGLYQESCGECHGGDLMGDGMAPALTGGDFTANWNGLTVGDLFERIRISMPPNAPSSVNRQTKADILAYLLSANRFPPGKAELDQKTEVLKDIRFEAAKP